MGTSASVKKDMIFASKRDVEASGWTVLKPFNLSKLSYSNPIMIDNDNYIVINKDAVYTYNISTNQWHKPKKLKRIDSSYKHTEYVIATEFDNKKCMLSLCMAYPKYNAIRWVELKLNESKLRWSHKSNPELLHLDQSGNIKISGDELHVISDTHSIWNASTSTFDKIYDFEETKKNSIVIYGNVKPMLILIQNGNKNCVYEYYIKLKEWKKIILPVSRPDLSKMPCVLCYERDKYVLLIGGTLSENIWIYDTEKHTFTKSHVKCPCKGGLFRGTIMNNYDKAELLLSGYLRRMQDVFIVKDVIPLVHEMMVEHYIYLLQLKTGDHLRILLSDILSIMYSGLKSSTFTDMSS